MSLDRYDIHQLRQMHAVALRTFDRGGPDCDDVCMNRIIDLEDEISRRVTVEHERVVFETTCVLVSADDGDGYGRVRFGSQHFRFPCVLVTDRRPLEAWVAFLDYVGPPHLDGISERYRDEQAREIIDLPLDEIERGGELYEMFLCDEYARAGRDLGIETKYVS